MRKIAAGRTTSSSMPWEPKDLRRARPGKREPKRSMRTRSTWMTRSPCCPRSPWPTEGSRTVRAGETARSMAIMGRLTPRPSDIARSFEDLRREKGALDATNWFYRLCCDVGYVRRSAIARNIEWTSPTRWGELEITINLSKPEKDPRDIAAALTRADDAEPYPACQLCMSNEGYAGRAAASHRVHIRHVKISVSSPSSSEMKHGGSNTAPTRISTSTASR